MIYATHFAGVTTGNKRRMNDETRVRVEYLVQVIKPATLIQDGVIRVSDLRGQAWFGPTGHSKWGDHPHHG